MRFGLIVLAALVLTSVAAGAPKDPRAIIETAVAREKVAINLLERHPADVRLALLNLHMAIATLNPLVDDQLVTPAAVSDLDYALTSDAQAGRALRDAVPRVKTAILLIQQALDRKQKAISETPTAEPPAKRCIAVKEFPVYGLPSGATLSYNDVYVHNVPKDAKHIRVAFVDLKLNGAPPADEFGADQQWAATPGDFEQHEGALTYHVRVNVTGQGSGLDNGNAHDWKIVVSYDC